MALFFCTEIDEGGGWRFSGADAFDEMMLKLGKSLSIKQHKCGILTNEYAFDILIKTRGRMKASA